MLEYLFFSDQVRDEFVAALEDLAVPTQESPDELGLQVAISDDLAEPLQAQVDQIYERLLQRQARLLEATDERLEKNAMGVGLTLDDGRPCTVRLDPDLVSRMLTIMALDELQGLVQTIAEQIQHPDNRPLCHD